MSLLLGVLQFSYFGVLPVTLRIYEHTKHKERREGGPLPINRCFCAPDLRVHTERIEDEKGGREDSTNHLTSQKQRGWNAHAASLPRCPRAAGYRHYFAPPTIR